MGIPFGYRGFGNELDEVPVSSVILENYVSDKFSTLTVLNFRDCIIFFFVSELESIIPLGTGLEYIKDQTHVI